MPASGGYLGKAAGEKSSAWYPGETAGQRELHFKAPKVGCPFVSCKHPESHVVGAVGARCGAWLTPSRGREAHGRGYKAQDMLLC